MKKKICLSSYTTIGSFLTAHEWIVCGFADLTGVKIQKDIWQRIDVK